METYAPTSHQERSAPPASATKKQHRASLSLQDNRPAAIQLRKTIQAIQASSNRLSPIQCYTEGSTYKTSDNRNFRTCIDDTNLLDKKTGATTSIDDLLVQIDTVSGYKRYRYNTTPYNRRTRQGNFVNDCGFFSDFLMTRNTTALAEGYDSHVKAGTGTNDAANPLAGEAYFMQGNTEANIDLGCVHHQATVIAKDGGDNITCEANAGARLTAPIFDMYGTAVAEETFHSRFKDNYGDDDHPATTEVYEK